MIPANPKYPTGFQHERLADMVTLFYKDYDIICIQEIFGLLSCELREVMICYAQKAGFIYQAHGMDISKGTRFDSRYICD